MATQTSSDEFVIPLSRISMRDVSRVGGKNASLGEMIGALSDAGIRVPGGFAVTVDAYWAFVEHNDLKRQIDELTDLIDPTAQHARVIAAEIQAAFCRGRMPEPVAAKICGAYHAMLAESGEDKLPVAVRSSATAEDMPNASFAGQQDTYLYVRGCEEILRRVKDCFASLYNERAIAYRAENAIDDADLALSVVVQRMVRSDSGSAGVAFSLDTETGNQDMVVISGAWGLGESVVQGSVDPDEFQVFAPLLERDVSPIVDRSTGAKKTMIVPVWSGDGFTVRAVDTPPEKARRLCLDDASVLELARWVKRIEAHYGHPVDVEWALDGETQELFIVQARPETVISNRTDSGMCRTRISQKGAPLTRGVAIGDGAVSGRIRQVVSPEFQDEFQDGEILVTEMTDPNWLPVMRRAAAIVTENGGRTSHAAIVARELGLPAITGAEGAMEALRPGAEVTVSCCEGSIGRVYEGRALIETEEIDLSDCQETRTKVMLNLADPTRAPKWWRLPADGVGLARLEFIVANQIGAHPSALLNPAMVDCEATRRKVEALIGTHEDGRAYFIDRLSTGIAKIAATVWPNPVVVRTSDFKTNEYRDLLGGSVFEQHEENPMLGWRGVSRYLHPDYAEAFAMECEALRQVRMEIGFDNVHVMLPFCRTTGEARDVLDLLRRHGLTRGENGLKILVMCEVPSNVFQVDGFCELFDGFSIGSNDLTQLILGVERDSGRLSSLFNENDPAVRTAIETVIQRAHIHGRTVGLCGQAPSDNPEFAKFLVDAGIDSISVVPDSFAGVKKLVWDMESPEPALQVSAAE